MRHIQLYLAVLFAISPLWSANYYLDAQTGKDANLGTKASPWQSLFKVKNLTLQPGDSILLKRGAKWNSDSIFIRSVGSAQKPIVFSAYGERTLERPHVQGNMGRVVVLENASHIIVEDWTISKARGGCVEMWDSTVSNILVQRIEGFDCGGGVYMTGTNITVRYSYFHDGHMVVNTPTTVNDNDDYGASGIGFSILNGCEVYGNRLTGLRAPSYDYGEDGGAIEFWKTVRNCDVWGNFSYDNNGFSEFGGQKGDTVENVSIHHNIIIDSKVLACPHMYNIANAYGIGYNKLHIDHNLIVHRFNKPYGYFMASSGDDLTESWRVKVRNNIMISDSLTYFSWQPSGTNPSYFHSGNLLWSPKHNFWVNGVTPGEGDVYQDPLFQGKAWSLTSPVDTSVAKYFLKSGSPAVASVENLGYTKDYFGNPLSKSGLADRGPIPMGSTQPLKIKQRVTPDSHTTNDNRQGVWNLLGQQIRP